MHSTCFIQKMCLGPRFYTPIKLQKKCIQFLIEIVLFILISSIDYNSYFAFLDNSFTSRVAQNAFDIDAIPNKVWSVTEALVDTSRIPYPLVIRTLPSFTTATEIPGLWVWHFKPWKYKLVTNGEHSPKFTQQVSLEYQRWLAERFIIA